MIWTQTLAEVVPLWDSTVRAIHADRGADAALGWAQEMYAFSLALASHPKGPIKVAYHVELMVEPPFAFDLRVDTCVTPVVRPCSEGRAGVQRRGV